MQHSLTLTAPPLVTPGTAATATTTFVNGSTAAETNVAVTLTAPAGWTTHATTASTFASVAAGQTVTTTWQVTAPAGTAPGNFPLSAQATLTGTGPFSDSGSTNVAYASIPAAYGNVGISNDTNTTPGNFDGGGASFSAQALAAAGLSPGATFRHDGMTFTWPNVAAGVSDNIIASGQTVPLSGTGTTLGVFGASAYGTTSGAGQIVYTDGTSQAFSLSFSDWWSNGAALGGDFAATLSYLNNGGGQQTQTVHMSYASVPLIAGKTVKAVVLPYVSADAAAHTVAMHIFALGISSTTTQVVSLRAHANNMYVTAGSSPLIANSTTIGAAQSYDLLDQGNGNIALRAHANNMLVTAENAGASSLIANRTAVGPWETFQLIHNSDGSISLKAQANGDYVTAENAGAAALIANRTAIGPWEEFDLIND